MAVKSDGGQRYVFDDTGTDKRFAGGAQADVERACGAIGAVLVRTGQLRGGRYQGHQPLCPHQAGEVLRRDC